MKSEQLTWRRSRFLRFIIFAAHYLRWRMRLGSFGWRSSLGSLDLFVNPSSIHMYFHCGAAESVSIEKDVLSAGHLYKKNFDVKSQVVKREDVLFSYMKALSNSTD